MLSVVLYGRNDSHGYNLHKRAAISLNAIAELLTDADDEILFVDYNTPDDLPTFPEAIADTLTDKAVARLRILRVRCDVHRERFAAHTHLVALEPIARNVAIRRSNPANRWVLSTNTDMIFCPREPGETLTSVVKRLDDGFYHLPRFELPEGLWETLDRRDAPGLIAAAQAWGERFHLNEITLADRDNVYDAPGDFQLFLRQDLLDIDGFNEEMILGWHLDANMAKRMRLLRGKVSSALDHLIGYHCDHTRQSTPYHKPDRTENDQVRFDDEVSVAHIPEQRAGWGLADVEIETVRLAEASSARYLRGLQASIPGPLEGFLQTQYLRSDFGRLDYQADHVLPYLLDLVSSIPGDSRIGYIGGRRDTWDKFRSGWSAMGGGPINLHDAADWLEGGKSEVRRLSEADWIEQSDMFIFDVGAEQSTHHLNLTAADSARLWRVDRAFKAAIAHDLAREAEGGSTRRVLIINGVHNFFEPQIAPNVAATLTPYSSRMRHGFISSLAHARIAGASPAMRAVMDHLHLLKPLSRADIGQLTDLVGALAAAAPEDDVWAAAASVSVELDALVATGLIKSSAEESPVLDHIRTQRPVNLARRTQSAMSASSGENAPSRLVRLEDWNDPAWAGLAQQLFDNRDHASLYEQDAWTWERVSLAQNLGRALDDARGSKVLVVAKHPEVLAFALAHEGYEVDIADPRGLVAGDLTSVDWRADFKRHGWVSAQPVGVIEDRAEAIGGGFQYDAVLLLQNDIFIQGRAGAADVLPALSKLLRVGGHLGFTALTQPFVDDERLLGHALPPGLTAAGGFAAALDMLTDLSPDGSVDGRVTPRSLDRSAPAAGRPSHAPAPLMVGVFPQIEVPGVFALKKSDRASDFAALKEVLELGAFGVEASTVGAATEVPAVGLLFAADLVLAPLSVGVASPGSMFDALTGASGLTKSPTALRVPIALGSKVAGVAPLGRIPPGSYEIDIEIEIRSLTGPGLVLVAGVVSDSRVRAEQALEVTEKGGHRLFVPLEVTGDGWPGAALLLKAQGLAEFDILNVALR